MPSLLHLVLSLLTGLLTIPSLFLIIHFPLRSVFFIVAAVWLSLVGGAAWYLQKRQQEEKWLSTLALLLTTALAMLGLLTLIEWNPLRYLLIIFTAVVVALLLGWRPGSHAFLYPHKPFRRMVMMLWVFNAYGFATMIFALHLFFPKWYFGALVLISGGLFSYISLMIWRLYFSFNRREMWLWASLMALVMVEIVWVMHLLPFGYLVAGLLTTWLWYLIQLLLRFHFSPPDMVWRKQRWFLLSNAVLFIVVLFLVRWV